VSKRKIKKPTATVAVEQREFGPDRFTVFRFMSDCLPETRQFLMDEWALGNQLEAAKVPYDGLPAVLILAAYAASHGADLVDDYDRLIERFRDQVWEVAHPDKFFASCCAILYDRGMYPDEISFQSINIPAIYEELLP